MRVFYSKIKAMGEGEVIEAQMNMRAMIRKRSTERRTKNALNYGNVHWGRRSSLVESHFTFDYGVWAAL
jgi:hypothetical protein